MLTAAREAPPARFLTLFHRRIPWRVSIRYGLGFAAARRVWMNAGLEFGGNPVLSELP
jgi:hypothetical protein